MNDTVLLPVRFLTAANDLYFYKLSNELNPLSANPTKWSNRLIVECV